MMDVYSEKPVVHKVLDEKQQFVGRVTEKQKQTKPSELLLPDYFKGFLPENVKVGAEFHSTAAVFWGNYPFDGQATTWFACNGTMFLDPYFDYDLLEGKAIPDKGEAVVTSGQFPNKTRWSDVIGTKITVNNKDYIICGIIRKNTESNRRVYLNLEDLDSVNNYSKLVVFFDNVPEAVYSQAMIRLSSDFLQQNPPTANASAGSQMEIDAAKQIGNELFPFAVGAVIFCAINALSLVLALLESQKRSILVRLSLGATWRDVFSEIFGYLFSVLLTSAVISYFLSLLIARISLATGGLALLVRFGFVGGLLLFSLVLSIITSFVFTLTVSRMNLSNVGRAA